MNLKIIFTLFLFYTAGHFVQGQTVGELFVKLPKPELLTLNQSSRLDLIDLYKSGEKAAVKNFFDDSCSIHRLTDDYLQIQIGNNSMEFFLLSMINDSKILGLIHTVCAPVCDSEIEFYTTTGRKIDASTFITLFGLYDFLGEGINRDDENLKNALIPLDVSLMKLQYEPDKQELLQYYTTPDYLSEADRNKIMPYLRKSPKLFKWNLTRFE